MRTIYITTKKELKQRKIKKIAKKLYKINKKEDIVVAISKGLEKQEGLTDEIRSYGLRILNGRWILKFLICDILEFVSNEEEKDIKTKNVAILVNNIDDVIIEQIKEVAKKVKGLKIITKDINRFSFLEQELYLKYGIAILVTNNKEKALANIDTIVNVDFNEDKIKKYKINEFATIINIEQELIEIDKNFEGKNINKFEIEYNKENYIENEEYFEFDSNILYESYIYRKDTYKNIYKQIKNDGVKIKKIS